jgi:CBS-domain-containing membrane protein
VPTSDEGLASLQVRDLMVQVLVTVKQDVGLGMAESLMRTHRLRHLPVLDRDRRLVGILTDRDLRRTLLDPALHERPRQSPAY